MIRTTIHCIVLPTSCQGIVSRVFGCHPSARNGSTRFLVPRLVSPLVPLSSRGVVPVFRVGRLFIIIIAIADLMSKPNATASAVFFYYRRARYSFAQCSLAAATGWRARGRTRIHTYTQHIFITREISEFFQRRAIYTRVRPHRRRVSRYEINHIDN